jgi:pyruvate/2-oxoglutarate/acetoin dehydrogenase E1 component/TPP-dependent pyruvate/acetoin dehydrogenase alpha subunit
MIQIGNDTISFSEFKKTVLDDYYLAHLSRQLSILGRKEVLTGKAKFGIFGDGKEIAQIALAKSFQEGDWRSGYYRDQTFMFATGMSTPEEFFALLYGDTNLEHNPSNGGRNFNNHFGTRTLNPDGSWRNLTKTRNSSADISPTGGQMPRLLGLAYASKLYRNLNFIPGSDTFSKLGNEVAFGTIGDASTSEGHFWEILNAAAVMQVPMAMVVWDDGYGISVPKDVQTVKASISDALRGFEKADQINGILIYKVKGWDYPTLCKTFCEGVKKCRSEQVPVVFHVTELTQPLGHSTSGSHERYKSQNRLDWEQNHDPLVIMRYWILEKGISNQANLDLIEQEAEKIALATRNVAYKAYTDQIVEEKNSLLRIIQNKSCQCRAEHIDKLSIITQNIENIEFPIRKDIISAARKMLRVICADCPTRKVLQTSLIQWIEKQQLENMDRYSSNLYCETSQSALNVTAVSPVYTDASTMVNGREIIRDNFDYLFNKYPNLVAFGEDVGKIGGVNQTYEGLQDKYGELRITDTGIRETAIIGQGIGMAMRGFRAIAEIQYFDYLMFALQTLSDDLATLRWRTNGGQAAPLIISTRGHRLEGVWHSGSPLSMVINSIRGIYVCVPRDMVQAAGFYNTLLKGQDPALVIEPLNGYRLKERRPDNLGEYCIPLGMPEIINEGNDLTLITYGSCVRIAMDAVEQLLEHGISVELIDVQTLLPFDLNHTIIKSIIKTRRVIFFDEDVPGGATAFMMQKVVEEQGAWDYLDIAPRTITAMEHRPAYTTDGDYFSNPNTEDVFETVYALMHETNPERFPKIF